MPTICGTPVIFIKKPDTSEQWIINSVVSLEPYTGLGKEKTFDVIFTSNNTSYSRMTLGGGANLVFYGDTLAGSGGNMQEAYRQITLEKPATGELKTWLEANAVRLPLIGTWVFKSTPTKLPGDFNINFNSNGSSFTGIYYSGEAAKSDPIRYIASPSGTYLTVYDNGAWEDQAYRVITFTEPVQYQGNEEFVKWFTQNVKPLPVKGKALNEYTWDEISRISLADKATEYGFKVGDAKEVTLNGSVGYGNSQATFSNQKYWVYIIGINHNEAKEGKGIAFQGFKTAQTDGIDIAVVGTNYGSTGSGMVMNSSNTNTDGWKGSWAYTTCMAQWKNCLSSDLQAVIRITNLYTDNRGYYGISEIEVTANSNEVYYLAEYEVFGSNHYANTNEPAQQAQYDYYKAGNSKVKYHSDNTSTAATWWLRSSDRNTSGNFCSVGTDGSAVRHSAYASYGSAPCFKV